MTFTPKPFDLGTALTTASLLLLSGGCASEATGAPEEPGRHMVLSGKAQLLQAEGGGSLLVAARWSTERTEIPGVYIQIDDVVTEGANPGEFDLQILEPTADVMDHESDGDYLYTSAELVLLDDPTLSGGWVDAQQLGDSEVGRSQYIVYFVASDIPASSEGHFGVGPVDAGFHLLERMPDQLVYGGDGDPTGAIAVWEEVPLDTQVVIEVGADGDPSSF